jgi:putative ABC transport system substrate-binding protein
MRRREFIALFGGAAVSWPLAARAQQPATPVVGFLRSTTVADSTHVVAAFRQGLKEAGFVEGESVAIEYRYADNQVDRLPALVADLIRRQVAVIVPNHDAARAAKVATTTIPIVVATGGDPIKDGFVANLNRPGGNITGVVFFSENLGAKRLEILRQLVPNATTIAMFATLSTEGERSDVAAAAKAMGRQLIVLDIASSSDLEVAFKTSLQRGANALLIGSGALISSNRERIVALAAHYRIAALYPLREFVSAGGLMSYGTSITEAYRQVGIYAGRILKGEKPGDLPVMQSAKFEFVINLKTAKALGFDIPPALLALADEVIE